MTQPTSLWSLLNHAQPGPTALAALLSGALDPHGDPLERQEGHSLLAATLSRWPVQRAPEGATSWPLPGQPWPQGAAVTLAALAAALVWRGCDPFEGLDQTRLDLRTFRFGVSQPGYMACPLVGAIRANLPTVVDQMLRLPTAPPMAILEGLRTEQGQPWLHACLAERPAVAQVLLRHGYSPHLVNAQGLTPLQVATSAESVTALLEAGARPDVHAVDLRVHWRNRGLRKEQRAMGLALVQAYPELAEAPEEAWFNQAFQGLGGRLPKTPTLLKVEGFPEPLSLRSIALMGLLLKQPTAVQKGVRFDALHALERAPWTKADQDWASALLMVRAGEAEAVTRYEDAAKAARRTRWREEFERLRQGAPVRAEADHWEGATRALASLGKWALGQASDERLGRAVEQTLSEWAIRVPAAQALPLLETWTGAPLNVAFPILAERNEWKAYQAQDSLTQPWPQVFRHATVMLKHSLGQMFAPRTMAEPFYRRWEQMTGPDWASPSPERQALLDTVATLPEDHPVRQQILALGRLQDLAQRPASPSRPRRRA